MGYDGFSFFFLFPLLTPGRQRFVGFSVQFGILAHLTWHGRT